MERRPMTGMPGMHAQPMQPPREQPREQQPMEQPMKINAEALKKATETLFKYKDGKVNLEQRLIQNEQWWKLRHWDMTKGGKDGDAEYASAYLFNVIISKHADGIQSYPQANILPREEGDKGEAASLSDVIPCVLEQNGFDEVYSDVLWQKLKAGTGVYGVFWDKNRMHGLGDIAIRRMDPLTMYWEPGVTDIQNSRNVFVVELQDDEILKQQYPELEGVNLGSALTTAQYIYEDNVPTAGKSVVISWYYRKWTGPKSVLHYCRYVGEHVLYATENDPEYAERGLYDHGKYPFVFDRLFPVEGSPCGFGYIDVCKDDQEQIDLLNKAIVKNAMMGSKPRYFIRDDGAINENEFADWTKTFVHVDGNLGEDSIRSIDCPPMSSLYVDIRNGLIGEMKDTSGNTDASNGMVPGSVTSASGIAALQEASGKTSRASTLSAYRAFSRMIELVIELVRQFYDVDRYFRITGQLGEEKFIRYSNAGMRDGAVFDIKVSAQTKNTYSQNSQNELALQLYGQGVFAPQNVDQSLMLLETMDFDGRDEIIQRVSQQGSMYQQLIQWQQMALALAQKYEPMTAEGLAQKIMGDAGVASAPMPTTDGMQDIDIYGKKEIEQEEHPFVEKARKRTREATQA